MNILEDQPLAPFTTFQIGGPADYFVEVAGAEALLMAINWAEERDLPFFVLGGGSNILFDDSGFRGLVIRNKGGVVRVEGEELVADSGVLMAKVVQAAYEAGLTGFEAWSGLPGTVGGAVYGNAGCFGTETKDALVDADVWLPGEDRKTLSAADFAYNYRSSRLKREGGVVLAARFKLARGEKESIQAKMREIARSRIQKQPPGCSTGSFFKNPEGDHAGRLLEAAGMKGVREGKAQISEQHANFFLNTGGASSEEILRLAKRAEEAVWEKFNIKLEREVIVVPAS